jgi:hypothetical protein
MSRPIKGAWFIKREAYLADDGVVIRLSEGTTPIYILREGSTRNRGHDAQRNNIMAAKIVTETIRTTLGPLGMVEWTPVFENVF